MVLTAYWTYRGFKLGLYPALTMTLVFFLSLMFTLNYYDLLIPVMRKIVPNASQSLWLCVSVITTYLCFFGVLLYFTIWLCSDRLFLNKNLDMFGGGFVGLLGGIACCTALLFLWFSFPFAERKLPVRQMMYEPHEYVFDALTFVGSRIADDAENRPFDGSRFLRDLRYGLPTFQGIGDGFFIDSVPSGLTVFTDDGDDPLAFYIDLKKRWQTGERDLRPSEKYYAFGRQGRTPLFVELDSREVLVAVIMDNPPAEFRKDSLLPEDFFRVDGEVGAGRTTVSAQPLLIKVYRVKKDQNVGTLIALFHPPETPLFPSPVRGASKATIDKFLHLEKPFSITDPSRLKKELMVQNAISEEADHMIEQLRHGGKALFLGLNKQVMAVEMTGNDTWKIFEVPEPVDLEKLEVSDDGDYFRRRRRRRR